MERIIIININILKMENEAISNYNLGRDFTFRNRVRSLLMKVSTQKLLEDTLAQAALTKIYALANEVIRDPEALRVWEQVFSMLLPAWGDLTLASSDDDIYNAITNRFNAIAGVNVQDV